MSNHDQCPTSAKEGKPVAKERTPHELVGAGRVGQAYWRGMDDLADTSQFRDFLEREFPSGASELLDSSRRTFMKLMGAGLALAGAATLPACRRPDHKILPYSRSVPEHTIPGKGLYFATSMPLPGGGAEGLLVETHENRPTKIEGNPLHPSSQGKSSLWGQAAVLDLYDPDRLKEPVLVREGEPTDVTWDDWAAWSKKHFEPFASSQGNGLAIVFDRGSAGPTERAQLAKARKLWPLALMADFDSLADTASEAGTALAFGAPMREVLSIEKARIIVAFDRDFLQFESGQLAHARGWGASRRVLSASDKMSRLYAIESHFSVTGAAADHRLAVAATLVPAYAAAVARRVLQNRAGAAWKVLSDALAAVKTPDAQIDQKFVDELAKDLLSDEARAASLIVCGRSQPREVHALCAALNAALQNIGATVNYLPAADWSKVRPEGIEAVAKALDAGTIDTIVVLNANPVFAAPADLDFGNRFAKAKHRIALSVDFNETSAASTWQLPGAHFLETWGDTESQDGTIAAIQPMIAPLFGGKSALELIAQITGAEINDGYQLVRAEWKGAQTDAAFEKAWRRALHDGVLAGSTPKAKPPANVAFAAVADAISKLSLPAPSAGKVDVTFAVTSMYDGRFANNAWLHELPDPASRVVWDNPAYISPKTAQRLGLMQSKDTDKKPAGQMANLSVGGRSIRVCCWAVPGIADETVVLPMGLGREVVGLVGEGTGFNVQALRTTAAMWIAGGATLEAVTEGDGWYDISCTQSHGSMEGRALLREVDLPAWTKHGGTKPEPATDPYGRDHTLNFAEKLKGGEFNEMPAAVGVYNNPYNAGPRDVDANAKGAYDPSHASNPTGGKPAFAEGPQWGMSIDLATCIGCNVCTVACQAENNIPVVGKIEVNKGRELSWIRIDRYFKGNDRQSPEGMGFQPVPCVHCENAPCEVVCPVNATVHGPEGHNYMVYNRCIGTRYCANNCPYKVRRFNFFDYGVTKFNGDYFGQEVEAALPEALQSQPKAARKINPNLIPPRLRKKLDEISKMQKNPNVTVRSRGVMEKCSYCIQRTNEAKIELKLKNPGWRPSDGLPDSYVETACQQACPTGAIVFGDILDTKSRGGKGSMIHEMREHQRSYLLLGYLATRPRTTYMVSMKNPNPALRKPEEDPFENHGHGEGGEQGSKGHAAYIDPVKSGRDGYVMSLAVLGAQA